MINWEHLVSLIINAVQSYALASKDKRRMIAMQSQQTYLS